MDASIKTGEPSNTQIMRVLLAKDLRMFRAPIIGLIVSGAGCYAVAIALCVAGALLNGHGNAEATAKVLYVAAAAANAFTSLFAAAIGGISIAGERRHGACDFLALLPVTRRQTILSKRIVGVTILLVSALTHGAIALFIGLCAVWYHLAGAEIGNSVAEWIAFTISLYGLSWLFSTIIKSWPICACAAIAITVFCGIQTASSINAIDLWIWTATETLLNPDSWHVGAAVPLSSIIVGTAVGLISLFAGEIYYLARRAIEFLRAGGESYDRFKNSIHDALIAKDWRLFRVPVIALAGVGATSYLVATISVMVNWSDYRDGQARLLDLFDTLFRATTISGAVTCLLASVLGGVAIAAERSDRTGDFVGLLPITRTQIVASKLIVSAMILCMVAGIHLLAALILYKLYAIHPISWPDFRDFAAWWTGLTSCLFGLGWLFSTFLRSGPISACLSIALTVVLVMFIAMFLPHHSVAGSEELQLAAVTLTFGAVSLICGTIYYTRRIAP